MRLWFTNFIVLLADLCCNFFWFIVSKNLEHVVGTLTSLVQLYLQSFKNKYSSFSINEKLNFF